MTEERGGRDMSSSPMKKCPYCAEEIRPEAVKCRYCGEFLVRKEPRKWYAKTHVLVLAFLGLGPFALPLVWLHPNFSQRKKLVITVIVLVLTWVLVRMLITSVMPIIEYYDILFRQLQ